MKAAAERSCSAVAGSCVFVWKECSPLMGFAFFKSFSIRGDSEDIPGFLAGCCCRCCCIKYSCEKGRVLLGGSSLGGAVQSVCMHSCCHGASLFCWFPWLVPMSPCCWTVSCAVKTSANATHFAEASSRRPLSSRLHSFFLPPSGDTRQAALPSSLCLLL